MEETIQRGQQVRRLRTQLQDTRTVAPAQLCASTLVPRSSSSREGSCSSSAAWSKALRRGGKGTEAGAAGVAEELSLKLQERRKVKAGA